MFNRYFTIRNVLIAIIVAIIAVATVFIALHGSITMPMGGTLTYSKMSDSLETTAASVTSSSPLVASGNYATIFTDEKGNSFIQDVSVPNFLGSGKLNTSRTDNLLTVIGRQTDAAIAIGKSGLVSYAGKKILPLSATNINGSRGGSKTDNSFPDYQTSLQSGPSTIVGLVKTVDGMQPISYDLSSKKKVYYPLMSGADETSASIQTAPDSFVSLDTKNNAVNVYPTDLADSTKIQIDGANHISAWNGQPLYSYANNVVAVVVGPDHNEGDPADITGNKTSKVTLLDVGSKKAITTIGFSSTPITNIILSENAKYLYVQSAQSAGFYDVQTGKQILSLPISIAQLLWKDDDVFAFVTADRGIFTGSISKKLATSIKPYNELTPTQLSFFKGNDLYFTGFAAYATGSDYPDAYRYSLTEPQTGVSQKLFSEFPHQGDNFYVDSIGNTITIQTTRYITATGKIVDNEAKAAAQAYVNSTLGNTSGLKIVNTYLDSDLRPQD